MELLSFDSLLKIHKIGKESRHREHVTYYAYEFPNEFESVTYQVPENRKAPELRITLDTKEDYALVQAIANHFQDPLVSSADVIKFLREHPDVAKLNAHIKQKPVI